MKLVYLRTALRDLLWVRAYYERVFREGAAGARQSVRRMETLVMDNPFVGRPTHRPEVKKLLITRTPFFVLYRPTAERIEILRVIDGRSLDGMGDE
ncbi:type II toxin-antitoxin system RelE/ParE family toxin [uncultured Jannaschia sp.]|uniref:type II toxin-antitoxin system RelE/ParE family toxin n=1 Tax=uncultured Jannaschia sp. TaxID=293347 RepID=UPI002638B484|nr:type II toxin-antitoxin system RelE/ParE family toxin [uncultured Jannaschia sp.]